MGMWALWRVHDVFEEGTPLVEEMNANGVRAVWALRFATPVAGSRSLPDGEVIVNRNAAGEPIGCGGGLCTGVPIPSVIPMPLYPMAPMPAVAKVDPFDPRKIVVTGASPYDTNQKNPGFPFWIGGCKEDADPDTPGTQLEGCAYAGHRPPTPPLDLLADGGLPRHVITGGHALAVVTRLDLTKELEDVEAEQLNELGTAVEKDAMTFHEVRCRPSRRPEDGVVTPCDREGGKAGGFITNGMLRQPGAPMADPCVDSVGNPISSAANAPLKWGGPGFALFGPADSAAAGPATFPAVGPVNYDGANPRVYKVANIMVDLVFNKAGWHYPQNRIITAFDDIAATYSGARPAEPFVFRGNTQDCIEVWHSNLTPSQNELDDYQIRFPTDIIGQHTHMPKFDLPAADGAANGWNYEDGTMSPGEVQERILAINAGGGLLMLNNTHLQLTALGGGANAFPPKAGLLPTNLPQGFNTDGARITVQRWMMDPVLDNAGVDRGIGNVFTHDHFGPSTFQQIGLYATVLAEPAGSKWYHNETGVELGSNINRPTLDGGPTSWQAVILPPGCDLNGTVAKCAGAYREFYFEYSDFQHAYTKKNPDGTVWDGIVDSNSFTWAVNTSFRVDAVPMHPLLVQQGFCPGGMPRPCPKAITSADEGTFVLNYRNEPVGLRVFDPLANNPFEATVLQPNNTNGFQALGQAGDLSFAFSSRTARAIPELNLRMPSCVRSFNAAIQSPARLIVPPGLGITAVDDIGFNFASAAGFLTGIGNEDLDGNLTAPYTQFDPQGVVGDELPCPQLTNDVGQRDPATPLMRAFAGDMVKVRTQVGAHEESHFFSIHGQKWLMNYADERSGWRNAQSGGISENFQFDLTVLPTLPGQGASVDHYYASDTSNGGNWNGTWGLLRVYNQNRNDLVHLPNNIFMPQQGPPALIANLNQFVGLCPRAAGQGAPRPANLKVFNVSAVAAWQVLPAAGQLPQGVAAPTANTLIYNSRPTEVPDVLGLLGGNGPLHDQTALMYVLDSDLVPDAQMPGGFRLNGKPEPLVLRANAGDCIQVNLTNRLPKQQITDPKTGLLVTLPQFDQDGWTEYPAVINRRINGVCPDAGVGACELLTFNANDTAPSSEVGFHTQLLTYDVQDSDGSNVGNNRVQTIAPGQRKTYTYYAGTLRVLPAAPQGNQRRVNLQAIPIEYGAVGIMPSDKLEQVNKGMVGAIVILPPRTAAANDPGTRMQANICTDANANGLCDVGETILYRDFVAVTQSGVNVLYANDGAADPQAPMVNPLTAAPRDANGVITAVAFRPVQNVKPEGGGAAADDEDSGTRAIGYKTEPEWFRLALFPPHLDLEQQVKRVNTPAVYSNTITNDEDPQTPIFRVDAGKAARLHFVEPGGGSRRAHGEKVHGHIWQREPHVGTFIDLNGDGKPDPVTTGVGNNPFSQMIGLVEGYGAANFFDLVFDPLYGGVPAGGRFGVPGDYWYGSQDPPSRFMGMWGIMRVCQAGQLCP